MENQKYCETKDCCVAYLRDDNCDNCPYAKFLLSNIVDGAYAINNNKVEVDGNVLLSKSNLVEIPWLFSTVSGHFHADSCNLTSLYGCPSYVGGDFWCSHNKLTSLKYCPEIVGDSFHCHNNQLKSLNGIKNVGNRIVCVNNPIESFVGLSESIIFKIGESKDFNHLIDVAYIPYELRREFDEWLLSKNTEKIITIDLIQKRLESI